MAQYLPAAQFAPVDLGPVRGDAVPVGEPRSPEPVSSTDIVPRGVCSLDDGNDNTHDDDGSDGHELGSDKEIVETSARLGADAVGGTHNGQSEYGEQFVLDPVGLIGHARSREYALDEDDTQDGQCGRHDGNNPGPGGQEAEGVAEYVLEVGLDTTCKSAKLAFLYLFVSQGPAVCPRRRDLITNLLRELRFPTLLKW